MLETLSALRLRSSSRKPELQPSSPEVAWVKSEPAFMALRQAWNRLASHSEGGVFMRHEWFNAAWQWRRADSCLAILTVKLDGAIIGIAPLISRTSLCHGLKLRILAFLTVPDTQWCEVLADPAHEHEVMASLCSALLQDSPNWDIVKLACLRADSLVNRSGALELNRQGLATKTQQSGLNRSVNLTQGWSGYYARRSRKLRKNNNLVANRLARAGGAELHWLNGRLEVEQLQPLLRKLVTLSACSWKKATGLTLNQHGPGDFIRRLTELASAKGWLSVWMLEVGGKPVAMEYQLNFNGHVHALRADFDETHGNLSPGSHLNWKLLERLFASGAERYWLGHGNNAYKLHWAEQGDAVFEVTAYNRTWAGKCMRAWDCWLKPMLSHLRSWTVIGRGACNWPSHATKPSALACGFLAPLAGASDGRPPHPPVPATTSSGCQVPAPQAPTH